MWLRRLVAVSMIITCIGLNAIVVIGFFSPAKKPQTDLGANATTQSTLPPTVTITATPDAISAGNFSAITWSTTGNPDSCVASDSWTGPKTPNGAESTGRLATPGNLPYTLTCSNKGGSAKATVTVAVGPANVAAPSAPKGNSGGSSTSVAVTYCGGRVPCYGTRDVASHGSSGNCWGWLGDRVINVSGFDVGFHASRSGVNNIQVSGVCGKNLSPAISGSVGVSGSEYPNGHPHQGSAASTSDPNYLGYFVGYYDSSKP